ncbi:unnamed protein product, partial [Prorocentrum cordatum]
RCRPGWEPTGDWCWFGRAMFRASQIYQRQTAAPKGVAASTPGDSAGADASPPAAAPSKPVQWRSGPAAWQAQPRPRAQHLARTDWTRSAQVEGGAADHAAWSSASWPSDDTSQWDAYANPPPADAGPPSTGTPPPAAPPVLLRPPAGTALGGYAGGRPRQPRHHRQGRPHQAWQQRPAPRPGA